MNTKLRQLLLILVLVWGGARAAGADELEPSSPT
jgi:hypothetical protein